MVISQPAVICLQATRGRWLRAFLDLCFGRGPSLAPPAQPIPIAKAMPEEAPLAPAPADTSSPETASEPLTATERRARAAAFRGLLLSRQRRFAAAQTAFADAVRLDPALDLTSIPTFWDLERGAHEIVIRAYEETGRQPDAQALAARLRQTYRPRLVRLRSSDPVSAPRG